MVIGCSWDDNSRMPAAATPLPITTVRAPLAAIDTDILIVPWFEGDRPDSVPGLDPATAERDAAEVRFFKTKNLNYARGDFLACVSLFSRDELTALGRRLVEGH